ELNGQRVGDWYLTPGWTSYKHISRTQTYVATGMLTAGGDAIGAMLGNGWYKGNIAWDNQKCVYGDRLALLLQLRIVYENGQEELIVSDETWKSATGPVRMSEIYHGETYDARLEREGWSTTAYVEEEDWQPVEALSHDKAILTPQLN